MTSFLFFITLFTGFIAGFVVCLVLFQFALDQRDARIFREACQSDRLILDGFSTAATRSGSSAADSSS
jgi:hypothetical protein